MNQSQPHVAGPSPSVSAASSDGSDASATTRIASTGVTTSAYSSTRQCRGMTLTVWNSSQPSMVSAGFNETGRLSGGRAEPAVAGAGDG